MESDSSVPSDSAQTSAPNPSDPADLPSRIDTIARKYFIVWIWSIIVGVVTSNSMVLMSYRPQSKGPFLAILTIPLLAITGLFTLMAWYAVLRFLNSYIIPTFFYEKKPKEESSRYLRVSVQASIIAIVTNVLLNIADQLLQY